MAVYGSDAGVKGLLGTDGENVWPEDQQARISALLAVASELIEYETGAVFGANDPETIEISQSGPPYSSLLYLPKGLRTLTGITADPTLTSGAWTGGTALTTSEYRLTSRTPEGVYRSIQRVGGLGGYWAGSYLVTGVWEDKVAEVPESIDYLANYLVAEIWKKQKASPAGFVGPDGAVVPIRNTFHEPEVRRILDQYRVNAGVMFF